jgi:hypothetical protein
LPPATADIVLKVGEDFARVQSARIQGRSDRYTFHAELDAGQYLASNVNSGGHASRYASQL